MWLIVLVAGWGVFIAGKSLSCLKFTVKLGRWVIKYLINGLQNENKLELSEVTSPTFNLLNEYQINEVKINHYDLFRLKSPIELENLDIFSDIKNVITLIEWPQIIEKKPKNLIELTFEYKDDHKRRSVQIKGLEL